MNVCVYVNKYKMREVYGAQYGLFRYSMVGWKYKR